MMPPAAEKKGGAVFRAAAENRSGRNGSVVCGHLRTKSRTRPRVPQRPRAAPQPGNSVSLPPVPLTAPPKNQRGPGSGHRGRPATAIPGRRKRSAPDWPPSLAGRLQLLKNPDGADNPAGRRAQRRRRARPRGLGKGFAGPAPVFIFGALADKNWPEICQILAPLAAKSSPCRSPANARRRPRAGGCVSRRESGAEAVVAGFWRKRCTPAKTSLSSSSPARCTWSARRWNDWALAGGRAASAA